MNALFPKAIFLTLLTLSCTLTEEKKIHSEWAQLRYAKDLLCREWPLQKEHLQVNDIAPFIENDQHFFLVRATSRTGHSLNYSAISKKSGLRIEQRGNLLWPQKSRYVGHGWIGRRALVLLEVGLKNGNKVLELRDAKDNVVVGVSAEFNHGFHFSSAFFTEKELAVVSRKNIKDEFLFDQEFSVHLLNIGQVLTEKSRHAASWVGEDPMLFTADAAQPGGIWGLWFDRKVKFGDKYGQFKVIDVSGSEKNARVLDLDIKLDGKVESWSAISHKGKVVLLVISGDTLLWEDAKMSLYEVSSRGGVRKLASTPINDRHIADPFLVSSLGSLFILTPEWLDYESTLGLYQLENNRIISIANFGVLAAGTTVKQVFTDAISQRLFIVIEKMKAFRKDVSLCTLKL